MESKRLRRRGCGEKVGWCHDQDVCDCDDGQVLNGGYGSGSRCDEF